MFVVSLRFLLVIFIVFHLLVATRVLTLVPVNFIEIIDFSLRDN